MGRIQVDGAVRHVSPVTARLFSKVGSEALGISSGEVLVPMATASSAASGWKQGSRHVHEEATASEQTACLRQTSLQRTKSNPGARERRVEVVRPCSSPPVKGVTCPHAYLESILSERVSTRSL